jgi:hypothetical protein
MKIADRLSRLAANLRDGDTHATCVQMLTDAAVCIEVSFSIFASALQLTSLIEQEILK